MQRPERSRHPPLWSRRLICGRCGLHALRSPADLTNSSGSDSPRAAPHQAMRSVGCSREVREGWCSGVGWQERGECSRQETPQNLSTNLPTKEISTKTPLSREFINGCLVPYTRQAAYRAHQQRGGTQIRTGGKGFAILCLTTWPCRRRGANSLGRIVSAMACPTGCWC